MSAPHKLRSLWRRGPRTAAMLAAAAVCGSCLRLPDAPATGGKHEVQPVAAGSAEPARGDSTVPVWIVGTGIHTALVFPYHWLLESGFVPPAGLGKPEYVTMSWGDEVAYVQEAWLNPAQVFNALCRPTPSVMEIIPVPGDVALASTSGNNNKIWLGRVPHRNGPRLAAFLNHMSVTGADGRPLVIGPSSWGEGFLLKSRHSYYFPRICNVWSAQALEACGCGMNALVALATPGVVHQAGACGFKRITPPKPPWETEDGKTAANSSGPEASALSGRNRPG